MGTINVHETYFGASTLQQAYDEIHANAQSEYGYDAYSGEINLTNGVSLFDASLDPMTLQAAYKIMEKRVWELEKGGCCEAISLCSNTPATWSDCQSVSVDFEVTAAVFADEAALRKRAISEAGTRASKVSDVVLSVISGSGKTKVTTTTSKSKPVTKHFVVDPKSGRLPAWENGFDSQAQARTAMVDALAVPRNGEYLVSFEVISMTRRADGSPLVSATAVPTKVRVRGRVATGTLVSPAVSGVDHAGWLIYGLAPC